MIFIELLEGDIRSLAWSLSYKGAYTDLNSPYNSGI